MAAGDRPELYGQSALRGIAAFTVFIAHGEYYRMFPEYPWLGKAYPIFYWHNVAVDLFFALSGFILFYVYSARQFRWRDYGAARFARIYPAYFVAFLAFVGMSAYAYFKTGQRSDVFNWPTVLTSLFLIQEWPLLPKFPGLNLPTWSISVECFLYIFMFPLLFYFEKRLRDWQKWTLIVLPPIFQSLLYCLITSGIVHFSSPHDFGPYRGILFFTSGFCLCSLGLKEGFRAVISPRLETILLLGVASSLLFQFPINRDLVGIFFPLLVYLGAQKNSVLSRILSGAVFIWLGDLSYSIYVYHYTIWKALSVALGLRLLGTMQRAGQFSVAHRIGIVAADIAIVLIVAHVSHYYFEMPLNRWLKKRLSRPKPARPAIPERLGEPGQIKVG
jgi:peptidoglycan/LPS O-acetylase OafA/YrhL